MDISRAALPPVHGSYDKNDEAHPKFNEYMRYRSGMSILLVKAPSFKDWLYQKEQEEINSNWAKHPEYPNFLNWMRTNKGGMRNCPAGVFPNNFDYWLNGGRW